MLQSVIYFCIPVPSFIFERVFLQSKVDALPKSTDFAHLFARANWYAIGQGPKYQQLYRYIANLIINHELVPTTQLPSEREFAKMTSVSRVTLRQSINLLTQDGLIQQRRGAGSFVLPHGNPTLAKLE